MQKYVIIHKRNEHGSPLHVLPSRSHLCHHFNAFQCICTRAAFRAQNADGAYTAAEKPQAGLLFSTQVSFGGLLMFRRNQPLCTSSGVQKRFDAARLSRIGARSARVPQLSTFLLSWTAWRSGFPVAADLPRLA